MKTIVEKDDNKEYITRHASYAVIEQEDKIGIVNVKNYYFLLGGGLEAKESEIDALKREVLEETGYTIKDIEFLDQVKSYEFNPIYKNIEIYAYAYIAKLDKKTDQKIEEDHTLIFVNPEEYAGKFYQKFQNYLLDQYIKRRKK